MTRPSAIAISVLVLVALAACHSAGTPSTGIAPANAIRVAACEGPPQSLPDSLAALLPPRTGRRQPDDRWADLAASVPGGFAGGFYDAQHRQILMLTKPELAASAKAPLAGKVGFPVEQATVRRARWDFLQLVNWYNYLLPRLQVGPIMADKDEALNRIHIGVTSIELRDRVVRTLRELDLPCDLVVVDLNGAIRVSKAR